MTARILVGTCSWADKTLVDSGWYPATAKTPEDRLRFYAEQFPIVEVDATYYGLPSERNAALWVERTPDDFVFDIKSYARFTHHPAALRARPKDLPEALPPAPLGRSPRRNDETGEKKGTAAAERFDYLYREEELEEWVPRVRRLAEGGPQGDGRVDKCHQQLPRRTARP